MVSRILHYLNELKGNSHNFELESLKILEPCAGEGIFIEELIKQGFPPQNITAYELDESLQPLLEQKFPKIHFRFQNFLGAASSERYDIIIGNPPYLGQNYNAELFQQYREKFDICEQYFAGNMDLFYYFIHLAIEKLKPDGLMSYITTDYWITKSQKTGIKKLKPHVLSKCFLLEYIDLSKLQIFESATGQHNCIFILQKNNSKSEQTNTNKLIHIIQVDEKQEDFNTNIEYNQYISKRIIKGQASPYYITYHSVSTNMDLTHNGSWNLLMTEQIKNIVDHIEELCIMNGRVSYLRDYFLIRNGLILITDDIFILKEGEQILKKNDKFYIKIDDRYVPLLKREHERVKKLYKSSSIQSYGYQKEKFIGYALYFNKNEVSGTSQKELNRFFSEKYPNLTDYLQQFKPLLKDKLINAKENPHSFYFPRRGDRIKMSSRNGYRLVDLEPFYENAQKIFFPYISDNNIFGYSENPYYATSDTYFLWPKKKDQEFFSFPFLLAYLNSKLVYFLFKAKNIKIKRSKTKLENNLPVPNLKLDFFSSADKKAIISSIDALSSLMIQWNNGTKITAKEMNLNLQMKFKKGSSLTLISEKQFSQIIENKNQGKIQNFINELFFKLFDLQSSKVLELVKKFYK